MRPPTWQPPFVGRQRELAALASAVDDLRHGHGGVLLVLGDAGIGKTRLVDEARSLAAGLPFVCVDATTGADQRRSSLPAWAWLLTCLGALDATAEVPALDAAAIAAQLASMAAEHPLVVVLDHHAGDEVDELTGSIVARLAPVARTLPLLVMVVASNGLGAATPGPVLAALLRNRRCGQLVLGPMPNADIEAIVDSAMQGDGGPLDDDAAELRAGAGASSAGSPQALARIAGGNPLIALDLARAADALGTAREDGFGRHEGGALLIERLRRHDDHGVLGALAVLRRPATLTELAVVAGADLALVTRCVERAAAADLVAIRPDDATVELVHPLVTRLLRSLVPPRREAAYQRRIARWLLRTTGTPGATGSAEPTAGAFAAGTDAATAPSATAANATSSTPTASGPPTADTITATAATTSAATLADGSTASTVADLPTIAMRRGRSALLEGELLDPDALLTGRELQVIRLAADGATNVAIARTLFVSVKTVERHLTNAFRKLGVPNRAAAASLFTASRYSAGAR